MGFHVSWLAHKATSAEELLRHFELVPTGTREELPDIGFYLLELPRKKPGPWTLLLAVGSDNYGELEERDAQVLSADGTEALYFWCSDTVMSTELVAYRSGELLWSIRYDSSTQPGRPQLQGPVPAVAEQILADLEQAQRAEDDDDVDHLYELTAEVGNALLGFKHDLGTDSHEEQPFQELTPA